MVHTALNRGTTPVELWATYLVPGSPGAPFRLDAADPGCDFGSVPGADRGRAVLGFKHGQTGVAPNAIELHPILGFHCLIR
jgi:hypothetical protein